MLKKFVLDFCVYHSVKAASSYLVCSIHICFLTLCPAFANSVDRDQLASEEANWSRSALFAMKYVNLYQQSGSSNLIGWKLEMGVASSFIQQDKG